MHYRVRYSLDFDLKICSGQVWTGRRPGEDRERTRRGPGEDRKRTRRGPVVDWERTGRGLGEEDRERTRRGLGAEWERTGRRPGVGMRTWCFAWSIFSLSRNIAVLQNKKCKHLSQFLWLEVCKSKTEKSSPKERTGRGLREDQERTGRGLS